jgi:hypothetical protein
MRSVTVRNAVSNSVSNGTPTQPNPFPTQPDPTYMFSGLRFRVGDGTQASIVTYVERDLEPLDAWESINA